MSIIIVHSYSYVKAPYGCVLLSALPAADTEKRVELKGGTKGLV